MPQTIATTLLVISSLLLSTTVIHSEKELRTQSATAMTKVVSFVDTSSQFLNLE